MDKVHWLLLGLLLSLDLLDHLENLLVDLDLLTDLSSLFNYSLSSLSQLLELSVNPLLSLHDSLLLSEELLNLAGHLFSLSFVRFDNLDALRAGTDVLFTSSDDFSSSSDLGSLLSEHGNDL